MLCWLLSLFILLAGFSPAAATYVALSGVGTASPLLTLAGSGTTGAGNTIQIVTSKEIPPNRTIILWFSSGTTALTISSVSDGVNTYTQLTNVSNNLNSWIFYCLTSATVPSGTTITANLSGAGSQRAGVAVFANRILSIVSAAAASGWASNNTTFSVTTGASLNAGDLVFAGTAANTAITPPAGYTNLFSNPSPNASVNWALAPGGGTVTFNPTTLNGAGQSTAISVGAFR